MDVQTRVDYLSMSLMFNISVGCAPVYMINYIPFNQNCHNTRNSEMSFALPHVKTSGKKTFEYNAIRVWNNLPENVKKATSKNIFKLKCKKNLFGRMYTESNCDYVF